MKLVQTIQTIPINSFLCPCSHYLKENVHKNPYNQTIAIFFGQVFTLKLGDSCSITKRSFGQMV
jgi:hypothetical protein